MSHIPQLNHLPNRFKSCRYCHRLGTKQTLLFVKPRALASFYVCSKCANRLRTSASSLYNGRLRYSSQTLYFELPFEPLQYGTGYAADAIHSRQESIASHTL